MWATLWACLCVTFKSSGSRDAAWFKWLLIFNANNSGCTILLHLVTDSLNGSRYFKQTGCTKCSLNVFLSEFSSSGFPVNCVIFYHHCFLMSCGLRQENVFLVLRCEMEENSRAGADVAVKYFNLLLICKVILTSLLLGFMFVLTEVMLSRTRILLRHSERV